VLDRAASDIKFLVYDDTDIQAYGYDSDDEEAMLQRALDISMEEDADSELSTIADNTSTNDHGPAGADDDPMKASLLEPEDVATDLFRKGKQVDTGSADDEDDDL
jgi:hypothetical protein